MEDIDKNINLFQYLINIDCYIYDYLHILYLKKQKTDDYLIIDNYYINFFQKIIKDINSKNTCIITYNNIKYSNLIEGNIVTKINSEYIKNTSISYLYLYYIIDNWDNLPENIFFYNIDNENTFPIEMYIVPKKNIDFLSNNYATFNMINDDLILTKQELSKIKQKTYLSFKQWWNKFIKRKIPPVFEYCPELTFSVKRENVHKNDKEYYQSIINYINLHPYCKELYYLDRCWYYMFL
jgi:hypothetical protein